MTTQLQNLPATLWGKTLPVAFLALVVLVLLAPLTAVIAIPALVGLGVHHTIAMARTSGPIAPFVVLLGLDILMLLVVVGSLLART